MRLACLACVVAVVPALDEAPRIGSVVAGLARARAHGGGHAIDRIVVIDDGSRDGTAEAALAGGDPRVEVVRHERPRGVGAAIARGYLRAQELDADAAVVLAGDGQMDPADLPALLAPLGAERGASRERGAAAAYADYVQGDRLAWHGGAVAFPLDRFLGVLGLALATRAATGLDVRDAQCGYTAIGRRALAAIDWREAWPSYGYPNDVLIRLSRAGLRVAHVPIRPIYAGAPSKLRWRHLPPILRRLAGATLERLTGRGTEPPLEATAEPLARSAQDRWRADASRGSAAPCA
jgi:glycosyltransferase involved in cell wall biosynthesis